MDSLAASLERSPELFPQALDLANDTVRLVRLAEEDYRRASFLDDRILTRHSIGRTLPWPALEAAVAASSMEESCGFIFHLGHVGSTLLARLLGAHEQLFALREPAILRSLAQIRFPPEALATRFTEAEWGQRLGVFLKLWSRTFRPEQQACLKATSFVSEIATDILARPSAPRALLLFVPPEVYLATILGGENSRQEARLLAPTRLARLHARMGGERWKLAALREGEIIAMAWACEMGALSAAAEIAKDRVLWLNFEEFLVDPLRSLSAAFRHFGIAASAADCEAILAGPDMHRYSKAPEHAYDAALRRDVLDQARKEHAVDISRGLSWLSTNALVGSRE
jgi:hypothetical protein